MGSGHHHAHGPANRGLVVLTTAAPLFLCAPAPGGRGTAVIALHGRRGITAQFERGVRAVAAHGYLVAAPYHYFRDGGPEYVTDTAASDAYALSPGDIDTDVAAAIEHVTGRLGLRAAAVIGLESAAAAVKRAGERHPDLIAVTLPDPGADDDTTVGWVAAASDLGRVTAAIQRVRGEQAS
ncbi:MAG TPA: hypothetical protein VIZ43_10630 [Trebonia sp.]